MVSPQAPRNSLSFRYSGVHVAIFRAFANFLDTEWDF